MNTKGPSGGQGARKQVSGSPVRTTSYSLKGGKNRGDISTITSRNLDGQQPSASRIGVRKQAKVNKGPMTDFSVSRQNLTPTKGIPKQSPYNAGATTQRHTQNSMHGKGTSKG